MLILVLAGGVAIAWAMAQGDSARHRAILFAAAVSGVAALSGWFVSHTGQNRGPASLVVGGLGGTLVRLLPMIAALGWVSTQEGGLRDAGAAGYLVAFYLVLLLTDIALTILTGPRALRNGGADTAI